MSSPAQLTTYHEATESLCRQQVGEHRHPKAPFKDRAAAQCGDGHIYKNCSTGRKAGKRPRSIKLPGQMEDGGRRKNEKNWYVAAPGSSLHNGLNGLHWIRIDGRQQSCHQASPSSRRATKINEI